MNFEDVVFQDWSLLIRTLFIGALGYIVLIVLLLISGKRTLSKWNAFDFVVTIALGSLLATTILSRETSLAQGAVALATLIGLQFIITFASVRSKTFQRLIKARPALLFFQGEIWHKALTRERVTEVELKAAMREHGLASMDDVYAVVLETDGSFSVLNKRPTTEPTTLEGVRGYPPTPL